MTVGSIHDPSPSHLSRTVPHCTTSSCCISGIADTEGRTSEPEVPEAPFYGARGQYRFPLAPAPRIPHRLIGIPLAVSTRPFGLVARFGGREQRTAKHRRKGLAWRDNTLPGTLVNEFDLARKFGVATTSIREFLNRFQRFGLVASAIRSVEGDNLNLGKAMTFAFRNLRLRKINNLRPIPVGTQVSPCAPRTDPSGRY